MNSPAQEELRPSVWHMVLPLMGIVSAVLLTAAILTYGTRAPVAEAAPDIATEPHRITLPKGWDSQSRHRPVTDEEDL